MLWGDVTWTAFCCGDGLVVCVDLKEFIMLAFFEASARFDMNSLYDLARGALFEALAEAACCAAIKLWRLREAAD